MLIDVNVLVASHREDHPNHVVASRWLQEKISESESPDLVFMTVGIASRFLRLVTNVKLFPQPSSSDEALEFINWLLETKKIQFLKSSNEWDSFRLIVSEKNS